MCFNEKHKTVRLVKSINHMNLRKLFRSAAFLASALAMLPSRNWAAEARFAPNGKMAIDRHALVARHDISWPGLAGQIPLGNGNFAFNADGTGLQTVGGNTRQVFPTTVPGQCVGKA